MFKVGDKVSFKPKFTPIDKYSRTNEALIEARKLTDSYYIVTNVYDADDSPMVNLYHPEYKLEGFYSERFVPFLGYKLKRVSK